MSFQPGNVGSQVPAGADYLVRRIADLERLVREIAAGRSLNAATIDASPGMGIRSSDFNGGSFANPGTAGNYFGGDGAVIHDLYLPPGSISNDVLATPLVIVQGNNNALNFALSTTEKPLVSIVFTVPEGFTKFSVMSSGGLAAVNNTTGSLDYLNARIWISTYYGDVLFQPVSGNGGSGHVSVSKQGQLENLVAGQQFDVSLRASVDFASWPADQSNIATLSALAFWLR